MNKHCLKSLMLVLTAAWSGSAALADNMLSVDDMSAIQGEQVTLQVNLNNTDAICAYSFELTLPEGVTVAKNNKGKYMVTMGERADDHTVSVNQSDGIYYFACLSLTSTVFTGNTGTVCEITLDVDKNTVLGDKTIEIKNTELGTPQAVKINPVDISCKLSVIDASSLYEPGYSIQIASPLVFTEDMEGLEFIVGAEKELTDIAFDLVLPSQIGNNELYGVSAALKTTKASTDMDDDGVGNVQVTIARKKTNTIADGAAILTLDLTYDGEALGNRVYQLKIKNITLTDADGTVHKAAPYTADLYAGESPKAVPQDGTLTFSGDYSSEEAAALFSAAIPMEDATVTTLDLSGVTALPENTEIQLANPNALICTKTDLGLANIRNVVIGNVCAELSLTGDGNFSFPKEFTATQASCTRTLPNTCGTVCLPYEVQAAEGYAFYTLDRVEGDVMYFNSVETLPAGTPAMIQAANTGENTLSAGNVTVKPNASRTAGTGLEGWTMEGTFTGKTINVTEDTNHSYFFIGSNQYWKATETLTVKPFRAYFVAEKTAEVKNYQINLGEETGMKPTLFDAAETDRVYDVAGKELPSLQPGLNLLRMKDGSTRKIIINN